MVRRWDDRPGCGAAHGGAGRLAGRMWSAVGRTATSWPLIPRADHATSVRPT